MPDKQPSVAIIGYGTMGSAIARALKGKASLSLISPNVQTVEDAQTYQSIESYLAVVDCVADIVILAVKPHVLEEVCRELSLKTMANHIILSIAAGVSTVTIANCFSGQVPVIARLMPNLAIGHGGACGLTFHAKVSVEAQSVILNFCNMLGRIFVLKTEDEMHGLTAISGSGPAYFYAFCERLSRAGHGVGLSAEISETLVRQTIMDAAMLLRINPEMTFQDFIQAIAVPGGTTQAGLDGLLDGGGVDEAIQHCVHAAQKRSRELAD